MLQVGYVQKIGDLWTLRSSGPAEFPGATMVEHHGGTTGATSGVTSGGLPVAPVVGPAARPAVAPATGPLDGLHERRPAGFDVYESDPAARLRRLQMLVGLASEPVTSVTHDRALGDVEVRGWPLVDWLIWACAFTVLRGKSTNVYVPFGREMIVGLQPVEAARALHVLWQRGQPPELPNEEVWIFCDDGLLPMPELPDGYTDSRKHCPVRRMHQQRAAAGLE